jgi:hypothetical protein
MKKNSKRPVVVSGYERSATPNAAAERSRSHVRVETQSLALCKVTSWSGRVRTEPVGVVDDEKEEAVCCVLGWFSLRHQRTK